MDLNTQKQIAENLKQLRNAFGYTQAEVAEALHICRSTYTLYELGKKLPTTDMLIDLATLYDVRFDAIMATNTDFYIHCLFSKDRSKRDIARLIKTYHQLSPHSQGKLIERAEVLLETDQGLAI